MILGCANSAIQSTLLWFQVPVSQSHVPPFTSTVPLFPAALINFEYQHNESIWLHVPGKPCALQGWLRKKSTLSCCVGPCRQKSAKALACLQIRLDGLWLWHERVEQQCLSSCFSGMQWMMPKCCEAQCKNSTYMERIWDSGVESYNGKKKDIRTSLLVFFPCFWHYDLQILAMSLRV